MRYLWALEVRHTVSLIFWSSCCLLTCACNRHSAGQTASSSDPADSSSPDIVWRPHAKCSNRQINEFVEKAVAVCASGDYDEYRLLWSYDHQPTSRKRFEQLRDAVRIVEIQTLKELRLRLPDGSFLERESPEYVLHASVKMTEEAKRRSDDRLADREMILRIVQENGRWRFTPAPREVKEALLADKPGEPAATTPHRQPDQQPHPSGGAD